MNVGRGYVMKIGRGYVIHNHELINYKGGHRAARAAKNIHFGCAKIVKLSQNSKNLVKIARFS